MPGAWLSLPAARIITAAARAFWLSAGSKVTGCTAAKSRSTFSALSVAAMDAADSVPTTQVPLLPVQPGATRVPS